MYRRAAWHKELELELAEEGVITGRWPCIGVRAQEEWKGQPCRGHSVRASQPGHDTDKLSFAP